MKRSEQSRRTPARVFCFIVAAAVSLIALSDRSHAFVIYDWVGVCQVGCTGEAKAVLTLADTYKPGEAATAADFVRITYTSNFASWEITKSETLSAFRATLPVTAGPANVEIIEGDFPGVVGRGPGGIATDTAGGWGAGLECDDVGRKCRDAGGANAWTLRAPGAVAPD